VSGESDVEFGAHNMHFFSLLLRLAWSLIPRTKSELTGETVDLYGPVMILLTLVAVMLLGMKLSNASVVRAETLFVCCYCRYGYSPNRHTARGNSVRNIARDLFDILAPLFSNVLLLGLPLHHLYHFLRLPLNIRKNFT